jgi:hypothetical protein
MRLFPAPALFLVALTFALAATCLCASGGHAATPEAQAEPNVSSLAGQDADDTPPPFIQRPKRPPRPVRPDLTFATQPAPKGFRDLPWGASLEQARASLGLVPVTRPRPLPGTFQRPNELLKLGQADIRTVAYYFPKGQFTGVGILFEGEANFFLLKDYFIELYGPGRQVAAHYGWTWESVNIDLYMKETLGELRYTYEPPVKK